MTSIQVADFGLTRKTKSYKIDTEKPLNLRWIAPEVFETSIVNKVYGSHRTPTVPLPYPSH